MIHVEFLDKSGCRNVHTMYLHHQVEKLDQMLSRRPFGVGKRITFSLAKVVKEQIKASTKASDTKFVKHAH